jgi:hypothetical protein
VVVRTLLAGLLVAGCGFRVPAGGDDPPIADAAPDGLPLTCTPGAHTCNGRIRETCGADARWDPVQATSCDFTCAGDSCVGASNVPIAAIAACTSTAPRLAPAVGTKVTLTASGGTHLDCAPDCGDPQVQRIDAVATLATTSPSLAYFCLSSISLPGGTGIGVPVTGGPAAAIAFVVDGDVSVDGTIDLDGGDATSAVTGGRGAPGGYNGSDLSGGDGTPGAGPCAGQGGSNSGSSSHWIGGGGGGGGGATAGGAGGNGRCSNGDHTSNGRAGGSTCSTDILVPLAGGSGGGSGGDGTTGVQQGWAGGGGGGALQILSRTRISVGGAIRAAGGAGYGNSAFDGGGGGGAGGAILLEAPALVLGGALIVDGGDGGSSGAGAGGKGATGSGGPVAGASFAANGQGGSGGGGAGGRIRLEGVGAACPTTASPSASCTAGALVPQ